MQFFPPKQPVNDLNPTGSVHKTSPRTADIGCRTGAAGKLNKPAFGRPDGGINLDLRICTEFPKHKQIKYDISFGNAPFVHRNYLVTWPSHQAADQT